MNAWASWAVGLARARARVAVLRENPEDVKHCPVCKEYQLLPEDEAIHGPMNLVYHQVCPICADEPEGIKAYAELKKKAEVAMGGQGSE